MISLFCFSVQRKLRCTGWYPGIRFIVTLVEFMVIYGENDMYHTSVTFFLQSQSCSSCHVLFYQAVTDIQRSASSTRPAEQVKDMNAEAWKWPLLNVQISFWGLNLMSWNWCNIASSNSTTLCRPKNLNSEDTFLDPDWSGFKVKLPPHSPPL